MLINDPHDLSAEDWQHLARRAAFASHRLVGWIFWDPVGVANYEALGVPNGVGYYIATRAAPLAAAGSDAVTAAFGSIHPEFITISLDLCRQHTTWEQAAEARNDAVRQGLSTYVPEIVEPLAHMAGPLWDAVDHMEAAGRVLFAAHRSWARPRTDTVEEGALSAWLAINCIREWRGDTHWAIQAAGGLSPIACGVLDGAWRGYEDDWLPKSRGASEDAVWLARQELRDRGLIDDNGLTEAGREYRTTSEAHLDRLCAHGWKLVGAAPTSAFCELVEPVGDRLMDRVDATAGPLWMPAGRKMTP